MIGLFLGPSFFGPFMDRFGRRNARFFFKYNYKDIVNFMVIKPTKQL